MPCRSGYEDDCSGGSSTPSWPDLRHELNIAEAKVKKLKGKLDDTTAMLCGVLGQLSDDLKNPDDFNEFLDDVSKNTEHDLQKWYSEHKKFDRSRLIQTMKENFSLEEIRQLKKLFDKNDL